MMPGEKKGNVRSGRRSEGNAGTEEDVQPFGVVLQGTNQKLELERLLQKGVSFIAVEDVVQAAEIQSAIELGNTLHKTSVLSGLATVLVLAIPNNPPLTVYALSAVSTACATFYMIDWQFDPLCKYQIAPISTPLPQLEFREATVLEKKDDTVRKILHTTLAIVSAAIAVRVASKTGLLSKLWA